MKCSVEEKEHKVPYVTFPNAGPHPRAMMIMNFDTESTSGAVEGSWWSQNLTCIAIWKHLIVALHLLQQNAFSILIHLLSFLLSHYSERINAEEGFNRVNFVLILLLLGKFLHDFVW